MRYVLAIFLAVFVTGLFLVGRLQLGQNSVSVKNILENARENCSKHGDRTQSILCIKNAIENDVKRLGAKVFVDATAEDFFKDDKAAEGGLGQCHDILHAIGQIEGGRTNDLNKSLFECSGFCTFGCYHGMVEGYVASGANLIDGANYFCEVGDDINITQAEQAACYHGLGHGFAEISSYRLKDSLLLCDLIDDDGGRGSCGSGVLMELYEPGSFTKQISFPADFPDLCKQLWGVHREACLGTVGTKEYGKSQNESLAISACLRAEEFTKQCFISLGQNMYFVFNAETEKTLGFCFSVGKFQRECIEGAVGAGVMSDPLVRRGIEICEQTVPEYRTPCFNYLGSQVEVNYGKQQRENICGLLNAENSRYCRG